MATADTKWVPSVQHPKGALEKRVLGKHVERSIVNTELSFKEVLRPEHRVSPFVKPEAEAQRQPVAHPGSKQKLCSEDRQSSFAESVLI